MWKGIKQRILQRHDFYVRQVREKVFVQFKDIESEAEAYTDKEYERIGSMPAASDDIDMSVVAEWANDRGQEYYGLLSDLKKQMVLGALAGIYHQWDKDLREFIERELAHNYEKNHVLKIAWDPNIGNVFDILSQFGWDVRADDWFADIEACRLIVSAYKHGKGRSLDELAKLYPAYLKNVLNEFGSIFATANRSPGHDWLEVSDEQFESLAAALRMFWVEFPERLFLSTE